MLKRVHTVQLSESQKKEILDLAAACRLAEPVTLSAPLEDGLHYFLGYEEGELAAMVFLFFPEDTVCECGAYTLPRRRRKGYFTELLEEALAFVEAYEEERGTGVDFCFLNDGNSPSSLAVLHALEAEYWYSEYSMSLELPPAAVRQEPASEPALPGGGIQVAETGEHLYTAFLDQLPIGVCMIIPNGDTVYFYGFEIKQSFRRMGYGCLFLTAVIRLLSADYRRITLQVSSRNTAAFQLYKKTGFRVTETLSYYLY